MLRFFSLVIVLLFTAGLVSATTYSCRDKQGRLFTTDNLQALPPDCRGHERVVQSEDPDNLHYVPAQKILPGAEAEFQRAVRDAESEQLQKQGRIDGFIKRAEQLVEQYRGAVQEKNNATRRWSYGSREIIQKADSTIEKVREGKKQLLTEIAQGKIPGDVEKTIVSRLNEIGV